MTIFRTEDMVLIKMDAIIIYLFILAFFIIKGHTVTDNVSDKRDKLVLQMLDIQCLL